MLSKIRALAESGLTSLHVLGDFLKRRIAPKPSLEAKRCSRLVLAAQSMTRGLRPACQGGRVTNKGVKRRNLNCRPRAKRKLS